MAGKINVLTAWWLVSVLSVASFAATDGEVPLVEAAERKDSEAVRALLEQQVDVNMRRADGATALHWAAHWDDLKTADLLVQAGADVNVANELGVTPLSLACTNGSTAMVDKLLIAGSDPNADRWAGQTALMTCARTGNAEAVKLLLARGANVNAKETRKGQTALMWAVAANHREVAEVLIEHGADVRARSKSGFTPLLFAAQQGNRDTARILLAAGAAVNEAAPEEGNSLVLASASNHEEMAIFLLENGADPNAVDGKGITALHYAIQRGLARFGGNLMESVVFSDWFRPSMLKLATALLAHGANPNSRLGEASLRMRLLLRTRINPVGATPFLLAAAAGDVSVMRVLSAAGANPLLATEEGTTPLMAAAGQGWAEERTEEEEMSALEAVKLAVALGADIFEINKDGQTALHAAAYAGSNKIIRFLVDSGASVDRKDNFGQTPLSIAEAIIPAGLDRNKRPLAAHESTASLLRELGAAPLATPAAHHSGVAQ